ncbi:MAG: hypothetical protein R6V57_16675 [Vicinamibacterales bacterium]
MMTRGLPLRVLVLIVLAWAVWLTGARDLLHNHSGLAERPDCPACRLDRTAGVTTSITSAIVAVPDLQPVGVVPESCSTDFVSGAFSLEPPPRSPPFPL